jgi:hypothetical protein
MPYADSFQQIITWRRVGNSAAARYVCFMSLRTSLYTVQSTDFFKLPLDSADQIFLNQQIVELFIESVPGERNEWYKTLQEAMDAHDELFRSL